MKKPHVLYEYSGETTTNINSVWNNILKHEGEVFETVTGLEFTYVVVDENNIVPYRDGETRWKLSRNLFEKALKFSKYEYSSKEFNNTIIGSSYIRGLLEDSRIVG